MVNANDTGRARVIDPAQELSLGGAMLREVSPERVFRRHFSAQNIKANPAAMVLKLDPLAQGRATLAKPGAKLSSCNAV